MCQLEFYVYYRRKADEPLWKRAAAVYLSQPHDLEQLPWDLRAKLETEEILGDSRGYWKQLLSCDHCLDSTLFYWAESDHPSRYTLYDCWEELDLVLKWWLENHSFPKEEEFRIDWFPCENVSDTDALEWP